MGHPTAGRLLFTAAFVCIAAPAFAEPATPAVQGAWQFAAEGQEAWAAAPPVVPPGKLMVIRAKVEVAVADPAAGAFWQLVHQLPPRLLAAIKLNGQEVKPPLEDMYYKAFPAIPADRIRKGANQVEATLRVDNRPPSYEPDREMEEVRLPVAEDKPVLEPQKLAFQTGPVLGVFGDDYFTVACRTSIPAAVHLAVFEKEWAGNLQPEAKARLALQVSPVGLFHRFRVPKQALCTKLSYRLTARAGQEEVQTEAFDVTLPVFGAKGRPNGAMRFVIFGDSRSRTDDWATMAEAVLKEKPDLFVFTGDMNDCGKEDWLWDEHWFGPPAAKRLLATVPCLPVHGNHEENAPVMAKLFTVPSRGEEFPFDWSVQVGSVQFIGIDGRPMHQWKDARWLDQVMAPSKAKFMFFCSHYPAYSSGNNGKLGPAGVPTDSGYNVARRVILPRLKKYHATAFCCAHEHHYERSDLPEGCPQLMSGGAGAPRSSKGPAPEKQNPYSKVWIKTLNYGVFEVSGDTCAYQAKTPDGKVIDELTFKARKP